MNSNTSTPADLNLVEPTDLNSVELIDDNEVIDLGKTADADVILNDLEIMANDFSHHVQKIRLMQENGFFKFASKITRNELLGGLIQRITDLDETAKVAARSLKKVKRVRVPDEVVDMLLTVLPGRL